MTPKAIGRYQILYEVGRGGMATVYRAHDPHFDRDVAVKVLPRELLHDPTFRSRFEREAKTIATLEHSAIVPVYDFGEENGQPYLVMRFMPGGSLAERIMQAPMSVSEAAGVLERLGSALDTAHRQGIVHRDLKPRNILFDQYGDAFLADFGIAKLAEAGGALTGSKILGTPAYVSPEQARGEQNLDGRSDIYALGTILFEMLTGKPPYEADTPVGLAVKHVIEPVPYILGANPDLPPGCEFVIDRSMAKDRDERFSTAGEMAASFAAVARGENISRVAAPPVTSKATVPRSRPRLLPNWMWLAGGVALLLAVGGIIWRSRVSVRGTQATPTSIVAPVAATAAAFALDTSIPVLSETQVLTRESSPTQTIPTPTRVPTRTPTRIPTRTRRPTNTKTLTPIPSARASPTPSATARRTRTATPRPTSTPRVPTPTPSLSISTPEVPTPTSISEPVASGALITFEQMGTWRRGDQPNGELTQTQEQVKTGSYAARLRYDFPATGEDFVVFVHPVSLAGQPNSVSVWVHGDGSGHYLNAWIQDAQNQIWSVHLGSVSGSGWQQMVGTLDSNLAWPSGHVSGPDNGAVDYPVRFYAIVLDRPGSGPRSGRIFIDDISVWRGQPGVGATGTPAAVAPSPTSPATGPTLTPAATMPPPGEIGRIIFTVKAGDAHYLYSTDPTWNQMVQIGLTDRNHSTCAGGEAASTLEGVSINLYGVNKCTITDSVDACPSPDGQYKVVTNRVTEGHTVALWRTSDNEVLEGYYQGSLNKAAGIVWAPNSQRFLFTISRSVHTAQVGSAGYLQIIPELDDAWPAQYSPDGSFVFYLKPVGSEGASDIFVVSPDGSNPRNLTNAPTAHKSCPRWRP